MAKQLKNELFKTLYKNKERYVSGQEISDALGCSRTAIWKYIEELRSEGFVLDAQRKSGYKLLEEPDMLFAHRIDARLKTEKIGRKIHYFDTVASTQPIAVSLAMEGAEEGTVVVSETQEAGKGRLSRSWHSEKGDGIWMSMILRPAIPINKTPQLTLLTAVAVAQTLTEYTGLTIDIKWPNDILINGKKTVGILTELQAEADCVNSVIVGIGINVNQSISQFPEELQDIATSLSIESGRKLNRVELITMFFEQFERLYTQYLKVGFLPIKMLWESYAISVGRTVHAHTLMKTIVGVALGINEDGVLLLQDENGVIHSIYSADIEVV
ncbi:MAG: biotin--[acetyl-CoA-carboxylase] ligase [Bacillaceae bacterium]